MIHDQNDHGMDTTRLQNEQMVTLLRSMREDWQHAILFAQRDLWYESGEAQGRAAIALEQVIEELQQRGL